MLLAFTTRRMVRSAHLALSPKRFTAQFNFAALNRYSYEKIHTASLSTARWADLSTRHHTKPSPKGSGFMWWLVLRWANLAFPTMPYAYIITQTLSHAPQEVLMAQFSLYVHKRGLKPDSFHFIPPWFQKWQERRKIFTREPPGVWNLNIVKFLGEIISTGADNKFGTVRAARTYLRRSICLANVNFPLLLQNPAKS